MPSRKIPVYAIFQAYGSREFYCTYELINIVSSSQDAINYIKSNFDQVMKKQFGQNWEKVNFDKRIIPVHKDMNRKNIFTFFGKRIDCHEICNEFGGFVVEEMELLLRE